MMNKYYKKILNIIEPLKHPAMAIGFAFIIGGIAMLSVGENPIEVYLIMFKGAFSSQFYLSATLAKATPIILTGLGASVAWRANCFAIGGEGQMIFGALTAAVIAIYFPGPFWIRMVVSMIGGVAVGGGMSLLSAYLFEKLQMSLSITTSAF